VDRTGAARTNRERSNEMSRRVLIPVLLIAAAVCAGATRPVAVEVPFDFYLADEAMPAGKYMIEPMVTDGRVLLVANRNRVQHRAYVTTVPAEQNAGGRLEVVFHKYGDTYFLAKVRHGGIAAERALAKSKKEREMARSAGGAPETVILTLESTY
jgi:hypothetical protein